MAEEKIYKNYEIRKILKKLSKIKKLKNEKDDWKHEDLQSLAEVWRKKTAAIKTLEEEIVELETNT